MPEVTVNSSPISVSVSASASSISVSETASIISVSGTGSSVSVSGAGTTISVSDPPLATNPAGTYVMPNLTVDSYGRVVSATQNNDIASAFTQVLLSNQVDSLVLLATNGIDGGTWTA